MNVMDAEAFQDFIDTAGYGIGYWCDRAVVDDDTYTVHDPDTEKDYILTPALLDAALRRLATDSTVRVHKDYRQQARDYLFDRDEWDYDAGDADIVVQLACFGEVVYG